MDGPTKVSWIKDTTYFLRIHHISDSFHLILCNVIQIKLKIETSNLTITEWMELFGNPIRTWTSINFIYVVKWMKDNPFDWKNDFQVYQNVTEAQVKLVFYSDLIQLS